MRIPFNRPLFGDEELEHMREAVANGHLSGDGPFTKRCHAMLEEISGAARVLLTSSCTDALEMSALLLDIDPGDEVVVPSFTFVSTINAFVLRGARPVFCDIRPDTLNIDEAQLRGLITERTRAIVPVHYAGVGCAMDDIMMIASSAGVAVVEDNAHGLFGSYRGRALGSFGALSTLSFHETKNISAGEGGALVVNDPSLVERAEVIREKGTNRSRFLRGQVDKYTWVDVGSSYLMSDLLAAVLYAQLERATIIQERRRVIWHRYNDALATWAEERGVRLPFVPEECEQAYHMFYLLMPSLEARTQLIDELRQQQILAVFHYVPLHSAPMAATLGVDGARCPVTADVSSRLVRLPFFTGMTEEEQERVIAAVIAIERPLSRVAIGQGNL